MTYIDLTPESLEDMTVDELIALRNTVLLEQDNIKRQIDFALADKAVNGELSDPIWFAKATIARRARGRRLQQITDRIVVLNREAKQAKNGSVAQAFLDTAREGLPPEVFHKLLAVAMEQ